MFEFVPKDFKDVIDNKDLLIICFGAFLGDFIYYFDFIVLKSSIKNEFKIVFSYLNKTRNRMI